MDVRALHIRHDGTKHASSNTESNGNKYEVLLYWQKQQKKLKKFCQQK